MDSHNDPPSNFDENAHEPCPGDCILSSLSGRTDRAQLVSPPATFNYIGLPWELRATVRKEVISSTQQTQLVWITRTHPDRTRRYQSPTWIPTYELAKLAAVDKEFQIDVESITFNKLILQPYPDKHREHPDSTFRDGDDVAELSKIVLGIRRHHVSRICLPILEHRDCQTLNFSTGKGGDDGCALRALRRVLQLLAVLSEWPLRRPGSRHSRFMLDLEDHGPRDWDPYDGEVNHESLWLSEGEVAAAMNMDTAITLLGACPVVDIVERVAGALDLFPPTVMHSIFSHLPNLRWYSTSKLFPDYDTPAWHACSDFFDGLIKASPKLETFQMWNHNWAFDGPVDSLGSEETTQKLAKSLVTYSYQLQDMNIIGIRIGDDLCRSFFITLANCKPHHASKTWPNLRRLRWEIDWGFLFLTTHTKEEEKELIRNRMLDLCILAGRATRQMPMLYALEITESLCGRHLTDHNFGQSLVFSSDVARGVGDSRTASLTVHNSTQCDELDQAWTDSIQSRRELSLTIEYTLGYLGPDAGPRYWT